MLQSVQRVYNEEHNVTKKFLVQAREGEERLRKTLKDYEGLLYEVQKDREAQKYEVESLQRDLQKEQNLKRLESDNMQAKLEQLQKSLKSRKDKNSRLKIENQEIGEQLQRIRGELNAKRAECSGLVKRIQEDGARGDYACGGSDRMEDV